MWGRYWENLFFVDLLAATSTEVLTLWVYYSSQIFFLGAEFAKAFAERHGSHRDRSSKAEVTGAAAAIPGRFHLPSLSWRPFGSR